MAKTAIIAGATGLTGGLLLDLLLKDDEYEKVIVLTRKNLYATNPKISEIICDLTTLPQVENEIKGDVLFCCLGTTIKKAGTQDAFKQVDYNYPVELAKVAKKNEIPEFIVISALGAKPDSLIFYNKVKGEMERDIAALNLPAFHIIQPSLIIGERKESRMGEGIAQKLAPLYDKLLIGGLRKYKSIEAGQIARAMLAIAKSKTKGVIRHENDELHTY